jgi:hypothetical protein
MKKTFLTIFSFVLAFTAKSQEATKSPLTFNGYIDSYYQYNTNNPLSGSNMGATNARTFDQKTGMFQLGLAQFKTTYSTDKVDAVMDLVFGNFADLNNYGNAASPLPGTTSTSLAVKQAYLTWKASSKLSITAGQFGTHIGYEVTDAPLNFSYSLSNLFNNGPFYHTGVKAQVALSDKAYIMAGLVNGVDSKDDNNKGKGFISQVWVNPAKGWNVYLNYIGSDEGTDSKSFYSLADLTTNYQITDKFLLGLNAAYGTQDKKSWYGVAVYPSLAVSEKVSIGARYELFDNSDGIRALLTKDGDGTKVNSFTLTASIAASPNLIFKPEFRLDAYPSKTQFEDSKGNFTKSSQSTIGIAAIFKY